MVKKSPENTTPAIVDNVEALEAKLAQMREAQALFATYTQEQVDKIFYEAAMAANKARIPLAKMAIEETGRGVLRQGHQEPLRRRVHLQRLQEHQDLWCPGARRGLRHHQDRRAHRHRGRRHPDDQPHLHRDLQDADQPETRNAIIISPHPAAAKCTIAAAKLVLDAAVKAGAPEGIIGWSMSPPSS